MAGEIRVTITYDEPFSREGAATLVRAVVRAIEENWQPENHDEYTKEMQARLVDAQDWIEKINTPKAWYTWETSAGLASHLSFGEFSFSPRSYWNARLQLSRWGKDLKLFRAFFHVDDHAASETLGEREALRMKSEARANPDLKNDWDYQQEMHRLEFETLYVGAENMRFFRNMIDHAMDALPVRETEGLDDDRLDWKAWRERLRQGWGEVI